ISNPGVKMDRSPLASDCRRRARRSKTSIDVEDLVGWTIREQRADVWMAASRQAAQTGAWDRLPEIHPDAVAVFAFRQRQRRVGAAVIAYARAGVRPEWRGQPGDNTYFIEGLRCEYEEWLTGLRAVAEHFRRHPSLLRLYRVVGPIARKTP